MKQWDEIFKKHGKVFLEPQEEMGRVVKLFKKHNVKKVLDLGCGTGRHVVYLAKKGFDVYGFDIAEEGIRITKEWLKKEKLKVGLKVGSIYDKLPYKDKFFDAVISTNTIHHGKIEEIRKAIGEIKRVLKPDGLIFITVRKRKFRKKYTTNSIIECYGKQKTNYKVIGPRMYVPTEGGEKDLIHYLFNKESIRKEFKGFKDLKISVTANGGHYCIMGGLRGDKGGQRVIRGN